jgi:Dolichyl-phosphate-mannose-protein mannosyltransferase
LLRLVFYAAMLPLWEGYDEWAHFSVVRMVAHGDLLPSRDAAIPADVDVSVRSAPRPWGASDPGPRLTAYEALQPPLYYWLMAPLLRIFGSASLLTQVMALRLAAVLLASLSIPLIWNLARKVGVSPQAAAVVAVMPGFAFDVARVANDCLAVLLFTALLLLTVRRAHWLLAGVVLGLGLLTKAYFLAALVLVFWMPRAVLVALAVAGWWYIRNLWTTGTLSGLSESVMLRHTSLPEMLRTIPRVPWRTAVDSILLSHLYFGGWSSLTVRSWMYHLFYLVIAVAAVGGVWAIRKNPALRPLAAVYAAFWLAQLYNVVLIYMSKGVPTSMGWYLYAVIAAEVVLCAATIPPIVGVVLFAALDLYATHFIALPYYAGLIHHKPTGALESFHPHSIPAPTVLWLLYIAATVILVAQAHGLQPSPRRAKPARAGPH